jgi:hypothetical protein
MYWISLRGKPAVKNKNSIIIKIPKKQKLDKKNFKFLMDSVSKGIPV